MPRRVRVLRARSVTTRSSIRCNEPMSHFSSGAYRDAAGVSNIANIQDDWRPTDRLLLPPVNRPMIARSERRARNPCFQVVSNC
jgi:hypothetical protein